MESIPYDPGLALGNIVDPVLLDRIMAISTASGPIDAAQETLNALIQAKRSVDMTIDELVGMSVDPAGLAQVSTQLAGQINDAATALGAAMQTCTPLILKAKGARAAVPVSKSVESPLDYTKMQIKAQPLSADSIKLDAQYFSFDQNTQSSSSAASTISRYVSASVSYMEYTFSSDAKSTAQSQVSSQYQNHDVQGTLVLTCGCTHKNVQLIAPLIIDPDKAIRCWNQVFPQDMINPNSQGDMMKVMMAANTPNEGYLPLLSGATYGSSFIGMVHVLRDETTQSFEDVESSMKSVQAQFAVGLIIQTASGGVGMNSSDVSDIKNMLSTQKVTSHCSLMSIGVIPSIKSNQVQIGVKQFQDDPATTMSKLGNMQNAMADEHKSVASSALAARLGMTMVTMENTKMQAIISGLASVDDGQNQILDVNSLMNSFEDYVSKVGAGGTDVLGVPITYYIKNITKGQLAQMWLQKYFPKYILQAGRGDDSEKNDEAK